MNNGYIGTFKGIPCVEIPQEGDKILTFFYDMEKYDLDDCVDMFQLIKKQFPKRKLIALPQTCNLTELDDTQLEDIIGSVRNAIYDNFCDWCQGGAGDLVYSAETAIRGDIDQESGMLSVYDRGQLVARRHVNFCPMCGRALGRSASQIPPTEE